MHTFSKFSIRLHRSELLDILPGAWFFKVVHPAVAQYKSLISNTAILTNGPVAMSNAPDIERRGCGDIGRDYCLPHRPAHLAHHTK